MLKAARVIKRGSLPDGIDAGTVPSAFPAAVQASAQLVKRVVLDAQDEAARRLALADEQCRRLLQEAQASARHALEDAERQGLERGVAQAASKALHLAEDSARADAAALPRVIETARVLTEHLLGQALKLEPTLIGQLALAALREVRSAHAVQFECHAADASAIAAAFAEAGIGESAVKVVASERLASGDFRLLSASGVLEASLGSRLDLLCRALLDQGHA